MEKLSIDRGYQINGTYNGGRVIAGLEIEANVPVTHRHRRSGGFGQYYIVAQGMAVGDSVGRLNRSQVEALRAAIIKAHGRGSATTTRETKKTYRIWRVR